MAGKEGFWSIEFEGKHGRNFGVLALDTEIVVGVDSRGGIWNGSYSYDKRTEMIDIDLKVRYRPDVASSITGKCELQGHVEAFSFRVPNRFDRGLTEHIESNLGPITFTLKKIRDFPD
jgi:hypothetical protein